LALCVRQRESIFRYFATMSSQLPVSTFSCFLLQVLHPLYRLTQGTVRADERELSAFAESVLEVLQSAVGTPLFLQAYSSIRSRTQAVRQARLNKKKQLSILMPQVAANRRQAKHELKRVAKKRKMAVLKTGRKPTLQSLCAQTNAELQAAKPNQESLRSDNMPRSR
jgi:hypothetical protein